MAVLEQLSSQLGDRTEASNMKVVARCLADPTLLEEIAQGFDGGDAALMGGRVQRVVSQPALLCAKPLLL